MYIEIFIPSHSMMFNPTVKKPEAYITPQYDLYRDCRGLFSRLHTNKGYLQKTNNT